MKLCIIGCGYVGLVSATCFADLGNQVICVDNDYDKIENLKLGIIPFYEPGLRELVTKNYDANRLKFSTELNNSIKKTDIVFICVGTPTKKNSFEADISQVMKLIKKMSSSINKFKIIVTKSTVPIITGDRIEKILSKKVNKKNFSVVSNPEFLREGEAIRDFIYPDRIVVGTNHNRTNKILKKLYGPLISKGANYLQTSRRAAELIKYVSNAFLATKIAFINEISNLCEMTDVKIDDISLGIGLDKRIGQRFLRPGPGYGGSCFPKDTKALLSIAKKFDINLSIIKSVVKSNEDRPDLILKKIFKILNYKIHNKKICFLGVTFKANTDDMRDSICLKLIPALIKKGALIKYYDPTGYKKEFKNYKNVSFSKNINSALEYSDLIIVHTEWNEFKSLNFKQFKSKKLVIFDLKNIYSQNLMTNQNFKYYSVGR
ncbi:MAG: UDP-glucose/GDP-mannose dehydrogenase family protein [Alphaproteobacteria bacterium]|nr:UDP-glucose/GDP-mannose dehydrogenase family protein [Alphaproteobacteria bacterium]